MVILPLLVIMFRVGSFSWKLITLARLAWSPPSAAPSPPWSVPPDDGDWRESSTPVVVKV